MIIFVWALVIFAKCLAQVQSFSAWRALLNIMLSVTVIVVPMLIIFGCLEVIELFIKSNETACQIISNLVAFS